MVALLSALLLWFNPGKAKRCKVPILGKNPVSGFSA